MVQLNAKHLRQPLVALTRGQSRGKHEEFHLFLCESTGAGIFIKDDQVAGFRILSHIKRSRPHIANAQFPGFLIKLPEVLSVGCQVIIEYQGFYGRVVFLSDNRLLVSHHAADFGTIRKTALCEAAVCALNPGNLFGVLLVRGPDDLSACRAAGIHEPFKL